MSSNDKAFAPTDGQLDTVYLEAADGSHTTLEDGLSYAVDGFHWWFETLSAMRIPSMRCSAFGVLDETVVLRGIVKDVQDVSGELTRVFVTPPSG